VQAQATRHQAETGREAHFTSLFTTAVEQLGAVREVKQMIDGQPVTVTEPNLEVRLGAIYAFERIARDSEHDRWSIMEVLCAYIRNPQNCILREREDHPRQDVEAALGVLGRYQRTPMDDTFEKWELLSLARANLQGADLAYKDLSGFNFIDTNLNSALFYAADLRGAVFGRSKLKGAVFSKAKLDGAAFIECDLSVVEGLVAEQLKGTIGDIETVLPSDIPRPTAWPTRRFEVADWERVFRSRSRLPISDQFQL
jgi:hypothetical protein